MSKEKKLRGNKTVCPNCGTCDMITANNECIRCGAVLKTTTNNLIHKKIEKLIPYISENFITYPLWEEGKYIPFVNFWQKVETEEEFEVLGKKIEIVFENSGYVVHYSDWNFSDTIHNYEIYPDFEDKDDGSYEFVNKDWSIEEMIDLLSALILFDRVTNTLYKK
jgi:hypothetical protein